MKRLFLLAAVFAVEATTMPSQAQKPMPVWLLSEAYMKQLGIAEHTNEKFDFARSPSRVPSRPTGSCAIRCSIPRSGI